MSLIYSFVCEPKSKAYFSIKNSIFQRVKYIVIQMTRIMFTTLVTHTPPTPKIINIHVICLLLMFKTIHVLLEVNY